MKKITFVFACALALASCSKEMSEPVSGNSASKITITATISDDFKTVLGDKSGSSYPVIWNAGDCLTLNGVKSSPLAEGGSKSAQFTFEGEFTAPYNLLYGGKEGTADVVSFKSVQTYVENTFDAESAPMYGSSNEGYSVKLSPLNSILQFNVKSANADVISSVSLKANGGEIISGDFRVGNTSGLLDGSLAPVSGGTSVVSLDLGTEGVTLQDGIDTKFYLAIPAGYYTEGFTVDFITASGETMELKFWSVEGKDVPAGVVYEFASTEFESNSTLFVIATPADLVTFANNYGGKEKVGTQAVVIADIEMGGETPYSPYKNECGNTANFTYYGTLDGGGHTISGLTTPLFNELYGYVKNLKIVSNIEYDDTKGQTYGIGVLAHYAKTDTAVEGIVSKVENVTTSGSVFFAPAADLGHAMLIGGILGSSNGVPVENCLNEATVTVDESTAFTAAATSDGKTDWLLGIGGIAGACQTNANSDITGCTNDGDIICNAGDVKSFIVMGGITGRVTSKASLTDCTNNGNLTVGASCVTEKNLFLGGIIGHSYNVVSDNLVNNGNVTALGTYHDASVGGIAGSNTNSLGSTKYYSSLINATNNGNITLGGNAGATSQVGGLIGNGGNYDNKNENLTNTGDVIVTAKSGSPIYAGGISGNNPEWTMTNLVNNGNVLISSEAQATYFFAGGIAGQQTSNSTTYKNCSTGEGTYVKIDGATFTTGTGIALGGFVGKAGNFSRYEDSTNNADVIVNNVQSTTTGRYDIGGVLGYAQMGNSNGNANGQMWFKNVTNNGDVLFPTKTLTAANVRAGGIVGNALSERQVDKAYTFDENLSLENCVNNGAITFTDITGCKNITAGGLIGHMQFSNYVETGCVNNGDITVNGSNVKGSTLYDLDLGGHIGLLYRNRHISATITGLGNTPVNTGKISFNPNTTLPVHPMAGGIIGAAIGYNLQMTNDVENSLELTVENCTNAGDIESSLTGWAYNVDQHKSYDYFCYCGGIIGSSSGPWTGASAASYTANKLIIRGCTNKATLAWGRKSPEFTDQWNGSAAADFTGGIIGNALASQSGAPILIENCNNDGNILSYDGCCGGIAGYAHLYVTIRGTDGNYCHNTGNICRGGHNKPQAYAGGIVGWAYTGNSMVFDWCWNSGYVYANAAVGGFVGYLTDNQTPTFTHFKNDGTIHSSTTTGNSGIVFGTLSNYAWVDGMWYPGTNFIAVGGKINAKNGSSTTFTPSNDSSAGSYYLKLISAYKNLNVENFIYDPATNKASTTEKATLYELALKHFGPESGKTVVCWDGTSKLSWE